LCQAELVEALMNVGLVPLKPFDKLRVTKAITS
jgi:hypothetical protein